MTNLNKLATYYNVHSHNELEVLKDLLENHLAGEYTVKVIDKLAEEEITATSQFVRSVKGGFAKNIAVFNAIIEVAKENKAVSNRLKKNLQNAG